MGIKLTRIDFRLIHGQVITRWTRQLSITEIVTVDTSLSQDTFMQEVFKMAAPQGVKINIYSVDEAVQRQKEGAFDKGNILLLFKSVSELFNAINKGLELGDVQIGGLGGGPGRKAVHNAITLDQNDADMLKQVAEKNITVYFQTTPDYPSEKLESVLRKFN